MGNNNNETTTKFNVDISELKKEFQEAKRQIRLANSEFKAATAGMDDWGKSADGVSAKITQLNKTLDAEKTKLNSLEQEYKQVVKEQGENSRGAQELMIKINNQKAAISKTEKQLDDYSASLNEMESESKDSEKATKNLDSSLDDIKDSAKKAGDGFTVMKGALASLVADGVRLAIDKIKDLGRAIIDVGKQSIDNYAQYEQLAGGVETLFGAGGQSLEDFAKSQGKTTKEVKKQYENLIAAQTSVFKNADNAYKSAGMSANEYMETVTSFSASLISGLGGDTKKAAKYADMAIIDMSDNANKMGTDMSLIQNTYQGFAKQNYTMLDNLKLGYGGTASEMARLINDSGVMGDTFEATSKNLNEVSFDKMIEAIHVVQDEMGITGTTAKEAADTIEGSKNSMQAAWQNLLTGIADEDADLDSLFDNLVKSVKTYGDNILPRIEQVVKRATEFLKEKLQEYFPDAFEIISKVASFVKDDVLPVIKDIAGWIKDNLLPVVKDVINWVLDNKDVVLAALAGVGAALVAWNLATVVSNVIKFVTAVKAMGAASAFAAAKQWLLNSALLANPIGLIVAAIAGLVAAFVVLWKKSEKFRNFWKNLWEGIKKAAEPVINGIKKAFSKFWEFIQPIIEKIKKFIGAAIKEVSEMFDAAWGAIKAVWDLVEPYFSKIWEGIKAVFSVVSEVLGGFFSAAWSAIKLVWDVVVHYFQMIWNNIKAVFSVVKTVLLGFFKTAWEAIKAVWDTVVNYFKMIWENIKLIFKVVKDVLSGNFDDAWEAIKQVFANVGEFFSGVWDSITGVFESVKTWFSDTFSEAWQAIKDVFDGVTTFFSGIWEDIKGCFTDIGEKVGDAVGGAFKTVWNFIVDSVEDVANLIPNAVNAVTGKLNDWLGLDIGSIDTFDFSGAKLAKGGVLKKGQVGLLEGSGAEAVVPLEKNTGWLDEIANRLSAKMNLSNGPNSVGSRSSNVVNNFYQTNNSPKPLSRLEIYRQSKNLLRMKGV